MANSGIINITGLWPRTSNSGREYMSGNTKEDITIPAGSFVMVFPNDSDNPKAPEMTVCYSLPREDGQQAPRRAPGGSAFSRMRSQGQASAPQPYRHPQPEDIDDGDIPF